MRFPTPLIAVVALTTAMAGPFQTNSANAAPTENTPGPESILHDPQIPSEGNPNGDLTLVEYFDYQCSSCKMVNILVHQAVREDGNIRLVFKDWPIFGAISIYAARLGLAAKYQEKFSEAHDALISIQGRLSEQIVLTALMHAGIDISRVRRDLSIHQTEINAILARNQEQATALGFKGTPAFLIEKFRVPAIFNTKDFKGFIVDARRLKAHSFASNPN
jgi:protein-disulfide isomerase